MTNNRKICYLMGLVSAIFFFLGWSVNFIALWQKSYPNNFFISFYFFFGLVFWVLFSVLAKKSWKVLVTWMLATLPAVFLAQGDWFKVLPVWFLASWISLIGYQLIKLEEKNQVKINLFRMVLRGFPSIGTALALIIATCFYLLVINYSAQTNGGYWINFEISPEMINTTLRTADTLFPAQEVDWILEGVTVDEYIKRNIAKSETANMAAGLLSQEVAVVASRKAFSEQMGIELTGKEKTDEMLRLMLNKRIVEMLKTNELVVRAFPFIVSLLVFLAIVSLLWLIKYPVLWTSWGIFYILVRLNWIEVEKKKVEVEEIKS